VTNRHVNAIAGRLSLRPPQRKSLELLDRVTEIAPWYAASVSARSRIAPYGMAQNALLEDGRRSRLASYVLPRLSAFNLSKENHHVETVLGPRHLRAGIPHRA